MPIERIQPDGLPKPPTYSQVIRAGNTVYIAGQIACDENGQVVGRGDVAAQTTQVFENLKRALASVGTDFSHLVKITTYLTDPRLREGMAQVRNAYVGDARPTSTLLIVAGLASPDYLLEVDAIAVLD